MSDAPYDPTPNLMPEGTDHPQDDDAWAALSSGVVSTIRTDEMTHDHRVSPPVENGSGHRGSTAADDTAPQAPPEAGQVEASQAQPGQAKGGDPSASEPPPAEDVLFANHLCAVNLLGRLEQPELRQITPLLDRHGVSRRHLLLAHYYNANGDGDEAWRRRLEDRYFTVAYDEMVSARELVQRLATVNPELGDVRIERIGSDEGPLVLRSGDHVAGVVDDYEEDLDTGEIDLRELEGETISVRALVAAANSLLDRVGVRERLVALEADDERETYLGMTLQGAMALAREELLEELDPEELMELTAW